MAVLYFVVRNEEQVASVALVRVHAEGCYPEVLPDRMPPLPKCRNLTRRLLVPSGLFAWPMPQPCPCLLSLLPSQPGLVIGNERARNL
jgi:hypothetical protein